MYLLLQDNVWYHVVIVVPVNPRSNTIILYRDGTKTAERTFKNSQKRRSPGSGDLVIGKSFTNRKKKYMDTTMDELVFWNRTLSADEVRSVYEAYA